LSDVTWYSQSQIPPPYQEDKVDAELDGYLDKVFGKIEGRVKDFIPKVKLLLYNNLADSLAVCRLDSHQEGLFETMGFEKKPVERSLYRVIERVGLSFEFVLEQHQRVLQEYGLVSDKQHWDWSSSYFEGKGKALGEYGHSKDGQPGKKQMTWGVSVGINGIPSALTIQRGNRSDKKHFKFMLKTAKAVLKKGRLLIFDSGGNTKQNKKDVLELGHHYLTLKPKRVGKPYKSAIKLFWSSWKEDISFDYSNREYSCVKRRSGKEIEYIYFSEQLEKDQYRIKEQKFKRRKKKNEPILKRMKKGKPLCKYETEEGIVVARGSLQTTLDAVQNPYINGLEGFFILQSSIDTDPWLILAFYKDRDKAEKLIRNMKEGTELRPIRHWNKYTIKGYVLLVFLANFIINLTLLRTPDPSVKNGKLLTKYLSHLTEVVYRPWKEAEVRFMANITPEIQSILGDFLMKYHSSTPLLAN